MHKLASFSNENICKNRTKITSKRERLNIAIERNEDNRNLGIKLHTVPRFTEEEGLIVFSDMNKKYNIVDPTPVRTFKRVFGELSTFNANTMSSPFS